MSKRYFPQQYGDRKKPKLDVSMSDHNFPLSQNVIAGTSKAEPDQAWGDDKDDEILLLASQACEEAYTNDLSSLPDYSICMQPARTSTQNFSSPNSSKFAFKKPNSIPSSVLSTHLNDKCNRISSPLPGISSKIAPNAKTDQVNLSDDLIFNDKIGQGHNSDLIYRQLQQLQEENAKLKSENGKLQEKCVTKEGESSILRTQLKSCQIAVDNARLERIKAQEKVQMEWTEKLQAANHQMHDLRNELDFKNVEIISVKEKVRLLESGKVKLRQVTVPAQDLSASQRGSTFTVPNGTSFPAPQPGRAHNSCVQTDMAKMLKLNVTAAPELSTLKKLLPLVLETTCGTTSLIHNEKLKRHDMQTVKCRVYSTFHRIPSSVVNDKSDTVHVVIEKYYKDLTALAAGSLDKETVFKILRATQSSLKQVEDDLNVILRNMSNGFQRDMDERYIEASSKLISVSDTDLLSGRQLFPEEQAILSRRMVAVLPHVLSNDALHMFQAYEQLQDTSNCILDVVHRICTLLDSTSSAVLYSGLLLSVTGLLHHLTKSGSNGTTRMDEEKTMQIIRCIISSRPMSFVSCQLLIILRKLIRVRSSFDQLCPGGVTGNLRLDYDQGVLLYKKDSCYLQVLLKQVEVALKCIEKKALCCKALEITQNLVLLYANVDGMERSDGENNCECRLVLMQVLVYAMRSCAVLVAAMGTVSTTSTTSATRPRHLCYRALRSLCTGGAAVLYRHECEWSDRDSGARNGRDHGHLGHYLQLMETNTNGDTHAAILSELSSAFQPFSEDMTSSYSREPWINSFQAFAITD